MIKINITGLGLSALLAFGTCSLVGCVDEPKPAKPKTTAAAKNPKGLTVNAPPADMKKTGVEFEDKVTLLGYKLDVKKGPLKPGDKVTYTLYWKLNKPLNGKGWKLYTHVFDGGKKRLLNIDSVGDLRRSNLTPDKWKGDKIYVDRQTFKIPKGVTGDRLNVVTGLWRKNESIAVSKGTTHRSGALALAVSLDGKRLESEWTPPSLRADKLAKGTRLTIDGKLNEPAWATAAETGAFVNVATGKAEPSSPVQGSAKLLWDDKALYLAFQVKDKDIEGGFKKTEVDPPLWTKDAVQILIDPDGDNRDYYEILVGPQNVVFDSRFDVYTQRKAEDTGPFGNQGWKAKLTSAVVVDGTLDKPGDEDSGYTVELSIPWASFDKAKTTPPALGDTWRMNFYATQQDVAVGWSPLLERGGLHKAEQFGRVLFAEKDWSPAVAAAPVVTTGVTSVTSALSVAPSASAVPASPTAAKATAAPKPATTGQGVTPPAP